MNWAYPLTGVVEGLGPLITYFIVMGDFGFYYTRIFFSSGTFESSYVNDFEDSYGQQWTYAQRMQLEHLLWTTYFFGIMEVQWANLLVKRTRRVSIIENGIDNDWITLSLFFETILAVLLAYIPFINVILSTYPLMFRYVLCPLPIAIWFLVSDEIRKAIIRRWPNGHIRKLTEY